MPALILTVGATVTCAHQGQIQLLPNNRVMLSGQAAAAWAPTLQVLGCTNPTPPASTGPDQVVQLLPGSYTTRVRSDNHPMLLQQIAGMGNSTHPIPPATGAGQTVVMAS